MKEKTIYVAFDGKEFPYEEDCQDYENKCSLAKFHKDIIVLDKNGKKIMEWWEEDWSEFYGLYFATQEAWQAFLDFFGEEAHLPGNYYSRYIESMDEEVSYIDTHWIYHGDDGEWHCLEKDLEIAQNEYNEEIKNF